LEDRGIRLPIDGLKANQRELQVEIDAVAGRMLSTPILKSSAVGSVTNSSRLCLALQFMMLSPT
jgi:hypothetical protein